MSIYLTVSGQSLDKKNTVIDGHANEMKKDFNILKETQSANSSPKMRNRRSLRNVRTRREVSSLVAGLKANSDRLENLTRGVEYLVKSTKEQLIGYTAVTKRLEAINSGLMNRLEQMDPFFVSMFVMLADVALSTSPRIDKHKEQAMDMVNYFRQNITTSPALDLFDKNMHSVFQWYLNLTHFNFSSCVDIRDFGLIQNDVYPVQIKNTNTRLNVFCDQETDGGGWLVFQRRKDGSVDFFRDWADYKQGFGEITDEFWLGNDYLHLLTRDDQELRVDLVDFDRNAAYANYSTFAVGSELEKYVLTVSGYSGTAGDSLEYHNGQEFSTKDMDNDDRSSNSCAQDWKGSWWYKSCDQSNLNGIYYESAKSDKTGINWYHWKNKDESLKKTEMKIRPKQ